MFQILFHFFNFFGVSKPDIYYYRNRLTDFEIQDWQIRISCFDTFNIKNLIFNENINTLFNNNTWASLDYKN